MPTKFPRSYHAPDNMKWGRAVESAINAVEKAVDTLVNRDGNSSSSITATLARIGDQIATINRNSEDLAATQAQLVAAGQVQQSESTPNATVNTGFYNGTMPEAQVTSPTGRIEVQFGGSLNGGNGVFVFFVRNDSTGDTVVDRIAMSNNLAQRVALSGGAAFTPSGYKTMVVSVPANVPLTVRVQFRAYSDGVYLAGASVLARSAL